MKDAWWKEAVVYQVYPRSFMDANGDGIGDLQGVTSRLDYLQELGIDVIWLSPVYQSPNVDNGYDISDYQAIQPEFGTMADFDELLKQAHRRGIRIVMDLVVNHSSDQHPWFVESRKSKDNPYRDYYIWREPKADGRAPNNWGSCFGGSAWQLDPETSMYYLHLFAPQQPDLNWKNPKLRDDVYRMMTWWCDKGVDGFRMDQISAISKMDDMPDGPVSPGQQYGNYGPYCINGPHVHEYLKEMNERVLSRYDLMTVGETAGVTIEEAQKYAGEDSHELSMVFQFEHVDVAGKYGAWRTEQIPMLFLKKVLSKWQTELHGKAWNSLFLGNHDQPRTVSAFGDDRPQWRVRSAKMLATCLHMMEGTPYIYQGEELGMTNCPFQSLDEFRDIDSLNGYRRWVTDGPLTHDEFFPYLLFKSRDNARTPMQWDDSPNAGFTCGTPWIRVNPNYTEVNAAAAMADPDSTFYYFQKLIRLRKAHPVIVHGRYALLEKDDPALFIYTRTLDDAQLLVMCNFKEQTREWTMPAGFAGAQVLISNTGRTQQAEQTITLQPYEALVLLK